MKKITLLAILALQSLAAQQVYNEDFPASQTFPSGWSVVTTNTSNPIATWFPIAMFSPDVPGIFVAESVYGGADFGFPYGVQDEWFISPTYNLTGYTNLYFNFRPLLIVGDSQMEYNVKVSTDGGTTWSPFWTKEEINDSEFVLTHYNATYSRTVSKSIAAYSGMPNVKFAFQFKSNGQLLTGGNVYRRLLNVNIAGTPTARFVKVYPSIEYRSVDNFVGTYDIEYGPLDFVQGTGTLITGLTAATTTIPGMECNNYDMYIRANIGANTGKWSLRARRFATGYAAPVVLPGSTTINWLGQGGTYSIEYGVGAFTPGTGTVISGISGNSYEFTDLAPCTNYRFLVKADCEPGAATTTTDITSESALPVIADGEYLTTFDEPVCQNSWTMNAGGYIESDFMQVPNYMLVLMSPPDNGLNIVDGTALSSGVNLTGGQIYTISYKYKNSTQSPNPVNPQLKFSIGGNDIASHTTQLLDHPSVAYSEGFQTASVTFTPAATDTYYFGFTAPAYKAYSVFNIDDFRVTGNLGTNDNALSALHIYPNPSNGTYYLGGTAVDTVMVTVIDCVGRIVYSNAAFSAGSAIDLSSQASGLYMIQVTNGTEGLSTFKVVKQ